MDAAAEQAREWSAPEVRALGYVIPAHNSTAVIEASLRALATRLDGRAAEVLVVENGSIDGTQALLERIEQPWTHPGWLSCCSGGPRGWGTPTAPASPRVAEPASCSRPTTCPSGSTTSRPPRAWIRRYIRWSSAPRGTGTPSSTAGSSGVCSAGASGCCVGWSWGCGRWIRRAPSSSPATGHTRSPPRLTEPGHLVTTELSYLAERSGIPPVEVPVRISADRRGHHTRITVGDVWRMGVGLIGIRRRHTTTPRPASAQAPAQR